MEDMEDMEDMDDDPQDITDSLVAAVRSRDALLSVYWLQRGPASVSLPRA